MAQTGATTQTNSSNSLKPKHAHIIGICGKATSALAIALKEAGWRVTGSDKGFYPPASDLLREAGVEFYPGWHPEKMIADGLPDLVVPISYAGENNLEWQYARDKNLNVVPYTQVFQDYFIKEKSLVIAGTWGKTSATALLAHIFDQSGIDASYMYGGISLSQKNPAHIGKSDWSIFEGDEYKSGRDDNSPKFFYYKPTHLLLTGLGWDHADLYPTEDSYFAVFEKLVEGIPEDGLLVACVDDPGVRRVLGHAKCRVVRYGKRSTGDYQFMQVTQTKEGLRFGIIQGKNAYAVETQMLGDFQAENIIGAFAMAREVGIPIEKISSAISSFKGIRQRLEKVYENEHVTVINDLAHSPDKARATLHSLRKAYDGKIIAIFEPNIGGRNPESAVKYTDAFSSADIVIIPRLTQIKTDPKGKLRTMDGWELAQLIARAHSNVRYLPNDEQLIEQIINLADRRLSDLEVSPPSGSVIVFLGSHGFRGMIEAVIEKLKSN